MCIRDSRVYSDHKNLVYAATQSQSQRVMRWRLILKEFGPDIIHIKGEDNVVADAISRLPTAEQGQTEDCIDNQDLLSETLTEEELLILEDDEPFPLTPFLVQREQQIELNKRNSKLKLALNKTNTSYSLSDVEGVQIVTHEDKIYVPQSLRKATMNWYHHFLNHPGSDRLYKTINRVAYWKGMANHCNILCKRCPDCQKHKPRRNKYGHLPPKNVRGLIPWDTVYVT